MEPIFDQERHYSDRFNEQPGCDLGCRFASTHATWYRVCSYSPHPFLLVLILKAHNRSVNRVAWRAQEIDQLLSASQDAETILWVLIINIRNEICL